MSSAASARHKSNERTDWLMRAPIPFVVASGADSTVVTVVVVLAELVFFTGCFFVEAAFLVAMYFLLIKNMHSL
jgi:hypothetical protein